MSLSRRRRLPESSLISLWTVCVPLLRHKTPTARSAGVLPILTSPPRHTAKTPPKNSPLGNAPLSGKDARRMCSERCPMRYCPRLRREGSGVRGRRGSGGERARSRANGIAESGEWGSIVRWLLPVTSRCTFPITTTASGCGSWTLSTSRSTPRASAATQGRPS